MTIQMNDSPNAKGYKTAAVDLEVIAGSGLVVNQSQWCVWSAKLQAGRDKPAKIPCDAKGKALSVSKPERWLPFTDVADAYGSGRFDGVGLLMGSFATVPGGLVGLDLDRCINPDGSVVVGAEDVVSDFLSLGSHVEFSPSKCGLRLFLKGVRLDEYREKTKVHGQFDLEVYDPDSDRYLTVTGVAYPDGSVPGAVVANQAALEAFIAKWSERMPEAAPLGFDPETLAGVERSAAEVVSLLKKYDKSGKLARLISGDCSDYADDQSAADLALATAAAYYCRKPEIIDGVIRASGLMREKWERKDYQNRTINKALKYQTANHDANLAASTADRERQKDQEKVADGFLIGGVADLRTKGGWRRDLWALGELLLRDKRLFGVCFWDEFSGFAVLAAPMRDALDDKTAPGTVGRLTDDHYRAVQAWFGRHYGIALKREQVLEVVTRWAQAVRRNPATERLNDLAAIWDGVERADNWLIDYCGAVVTAEDGRDVADYVRAAGSRALLSVVARAYQPGCKADAMLILEGRQGTRKSSAVRALAEAIGPDYFREGFHLGEGSGKDARIALRGRLIIEWGELSGMGKKDRNELKTFLTQQVDSYRSVYGLTETDWPRTAIFFGSTNESHYLSDPSGNRRFWPVKIRRVDLERLRADAAQIWAEVVVKYRAGSRWWFDSHDPRDKKLLLMAEREQAQRVGSGLWEELAANLADRLVRGELPVLDGGVVARYTDGFTGDQIRAWLSSMVEGGTKIDDVGWLRVAEGMRRAGWESYKSGRNKWRLNIERREELCQIWEIDQGPYQSLTEIAAENLAQRAVNTARSGVGLKL